MPFRGDRDLSSRRFSASGPDLLEKMKVGVSPEADRRGGARRRKPTSGSAGSGSMSRSPADLRECNDPPAQVVKTGLKRSRISDGAQ